MREVKFMVPDEATDVEVTFKLRLEPEPRPVRALKKMAEDVKKWGAQGPPLDAPEEPKAQAEDGETAMNWKCPNCGAWNADPLNISQPSHCIHCDIVPTREDFQRVHQMPGPEPTLWEINPVKETKTEDKVLATLEECPVCHKRFSRLKMHLTTSQCNPKNVAKLKAKGVRSGEVPEIGAIRCQHCEHICRTEEARLKHEARCKKNPNRVPHNAGYNDTHGNGKSTVVEEGEKEDWKVTEPLGPITDSRTEEEKKAEEKPDEFQEPAESKKGTALSPDEEFKQIAISNGVCPDCGRAILVTYARHKPHCPGKAVVHEEPKVEPLNVSAMKTVEPEPEEERFKNFKLPVPKQHLVRQCYSCGTEISEKRGVPLCEQCYKRSSTRAREAAKDAERKAGVWV